MENWLKACDRFLLQMATAREDPKRRHDTLKEEAVDGHRWWTTHASSTVKCVHKLSATRSCHGCFTASRTLIHTAPGIHLSSSPVESLVADVEHRIVFLYQIALVRRDPPTIDLATTGF